MIRAAGAGALFVQIGERMEWCKAYWPYMGSAILST